MSVFSQDRFDRHESVHFFNDADTGLRAIISVHSTRRGPTAGGTRFWSYENDDAAIRDALNLSKAMSYKNAMADIPFGGGKAVIMRPDGKFDREALFRSYGQAIEKLNGLYYTAEDVGVSPSDMEVVRTQTKYVAGLNSGAAASGDPSPVTADGVFRGLEVAVRHKLGRVSLEGLHVAVQGLGSVGYNLCERLHDAGARLSVTDLNSDILEKARTRLNANVVGLDEIYKTDADIFAPCALGGSINPEPIKTLKACIIGGAANNQLSSPEMGDVLHKKGIVYCPDYVINGGGIINVAAEISGHYDPDWVERKLVGLRDTLDALITQSAEENRPTNVVADEMAEKRIYGND